LKFIANIIKAFTVLLSITVINFQEKSHSLFITTFILSFGIFGDFLSNLLLYSREWKSECQKRRVRFLIIGIILSGSLSCISIRCACDYNGSDFSSAKTFEKAIDSYSENLPNYNNLKKIIRKVQENKPESNSIFLKYSYILKYVLIFSVLLYVANAYYYYDEFISLCKRDSKS